MNKLKLKTPGIKWIKHTWMGVKDTTWYGYVNDVGVIILSKQSDGAAYYMHLPIYKKFAAKNWKEAKSHAERLLTDWLNSIAEPSDMIPVEEVRKMVEEIKELVKISPKNHEGEIYRGNVDSIVSKYIKERE